MAGDDFSKIVLRFLSFLVVIVMADRASATDGQSKAATGAAVLKTYCVSCHSGTKPKGELDIVALAQDLTDNGAFAKNSERWKNVYERLADATMPPAGKLKPTAAERDSVLAWIGPGVLAGSAQKTATEGRARLRRLNRVEYANTLRDLLGAEVDIELLPEDGVAGGFDNVDLALDVSTALLERYLEAVDAALDQAFMKGLKPESKTVHLDVPAIGKLPPTRGLKNVPRFGKFAQLRDDEVVFQTYNASNLVFYEADMRDKKPGVYKFRISARAVRNGAGMTALAFTQRQTIQGAFTRVIGAFDVADTPTVVEIPIFLNQFESLQVVPYGLPRLNEKSPADYEGPGFAVQWIERIGPLVESWPPAATMRLLNGVDLATGTFDDAQTILRQFAARAFRRPVTEAELAPYFGLVQAKLDDGGTFEAALRVGLTGVLCSPDFLYLSTTPGRLNDFDLAARLSYFLWSTLPDDALIAVAAAGELGNTEVLRQQVEGMLRDPKAQAFTENFTGQWLSLRKLTDTKPDPRVYPEFDELLELSLPQETHRFFDEILREDRSVLEFVHSDWSMLNERLATLYGIPGVKGYTIRKVPLPADSHRGGVMTQAAVLKVTANGTNTSPVVRGAWVLDRILGTPAPPPPKDIPAIEPDIRGATTLREQLAKHKQIESCAACHVQIDPPGNALENFDVIGGWRENYRRNVSLGGKERMMVPLGHGGSAVVGVGPKVDAGDELADGAKFDDVDGFKRLVLRQPESFIRGFTEKLLAYATGHAVEFADRGAVDTIVSEANAKQYGFRTLLHAIVQSETFRNK